MRNQWSNPPRRRRLGPGIDPSAIFASIYDPMLQMGYDMSPGYGDVLAGQRALEAYGNMGQSLQDMRLGDALGFGAQGLTEQLSMIPAIGDLATAAKGLTGLAGTMIGRQGMSRLDPAREIRAEKITSDYYGEPLSFSKESDLAVMDDAPTDLLWDQTQGYFGPEGLPRFEISDKDAFVDVDAVTPYFTRGEMDKINKLQDVFHHNEFFKAYPDFNPTVVSFRDPGNDMMAAYDEIEDTIYLNISSLKDEVKETGLGMADVLKRVMLHENQHGIQALEGFARGGNSVESVYRKLAGENESFMVGSARADLPQDISKLFPPFDTNMPYSMRYPLDEQIVRMGPGTSNGD